ncbi:ATP-dependent DNA helicase pif1-like [Leptidea sinapis]|uniref:ATP-dependent DNA helicase pif1-like n=1 Tax=Leptidea sinapis TaxID=189913 RepID=UPI0021C2DFDF|nr:ATP-dependent DNA helicase pif1-like [Leptidea sinapis]
MNEVFNRCLILIEDVVLAQAGKHLDQFGLPKPKRPAVNLENREYLRERNYNPCAVGEVVSHREELLTGDQANVYQQILASIEREIGDIFFLDAPGGTGKTFFINVILAKVRNNRGIALAVTSSGIAATLLMRGKTTHTAFRLPLELLSLFTDLLNLNHTETPLCNIPKQSNAAQVLHDCKIIVWDESTVLHKGAFEALNRTLKDIRENNFTMDRVTV